MTIDLYRTPLLTARETARHLKMPESTLNVWLAAGPHEPLVHAVRPEQRGWPRVPFVGIVEAHVLRAPWRSPFASVGYMLVRTAAAALLAARALFAAPPLPPVNV
jgi:hypothetical protein